MGYKKRLKKQKQRDGQPKTQQQRRIIIDRISKIYQNSAQFVIAHLKPRLSVFFDKLQNNKIIKSKQKYIESQMPAQVKNGFYLLAAWFINDFKDHGNQREFRGVDISKTYDVNTLMKRYFIGGQRGEIIQSTRDVINNYNLMNDLNGQALNWRIRWLPNFSNTIKNIEFNTKVEALKRMVKLQLGYFQDITVFRVGPIKYHFLGMVRLNYKFNMTFGVFPERVPQYSYQQKFVLKRPQVEQERSQNLIVGYYYRQVLVILDLVKSTTNYESSFKKNQVKKYLDEIEGDPDRWGCFSILSERDRKVDMRYFRHYDDDEYTPQLSYTLKPCAQYTSADKYVPLLDHHSYLTDSQIKKMKFSKDLMRYINVEEKNQAEQLRKERHNGTLRDQILNKFADAESAKWFVGFLQKIPNFKLHLTEEESNTIGQNGNVLALGRSGTGKTTCSVLRLFATEVLFKLRLRHLMNIQKDGDNDSGILVSTQKKKERFNYQDLGMSCGLHMVFVTASPVLTTQVKRFYESLKDKVAEELKKVKERRLKRRQQRLKKQREQELKQKEIVVIDKIEEVEEEQKKIPDAQSESDEDDDDDDDDDEQEDMKTELKLDELKAQQDKIEDELDLQQQLNLPDTFYHMTSDDFPVFLTIRRMIFMIDGCFTRSFFVRNSKRQIVGQSSSSQWHNESKGVMLINRYFKSGERREDNSQKFISNDMANVNELLDSSSGQDDQSQSQDDENDADEIKAPDQQGQSDQQKGLRNKKKRKQPQAVQVYSTEVDYDLFEHRIWPRIRNRNHPHLTSSVVWAQIMNRLKGGSQAYLNPAGYLEKFYYLQNFAKNAPKRYNQNLKVSKAAKKGQKQLFYEDYQEIFEIFIKYERWKVNYGAFDFCDVVNHILYCLHAGYAYRGAPLHFIMCDQVQDLSPCVSLLLIKLSQYCFFSGDSAQTIAKGVGFKFSDLIQLFNTRTYHGVSKKKSPVLHQLSINFRSHGKILDLANIIIKMIQIGYPTTIDKLKREVSWQDGMKPIILDSNLVECLFGVLVGTQALEKEENKKNDQQEGSGLISKPPVQFGCDQVVIVRDQRAKHNLPEILSHALCLTIYQSKGLQFDDVILYNFFTDSPLTEKEWGLVNQLKVKSQKHTEYQLLTMDSKSKQKYDNVVDTFGVKTSIQTREKTEQEIKNYIDENYKFIGKAMNQHVKQNPNVDINSLKYQDFIQAQDRVVKYKKQTMLFLEDQYHDKIRFSQELSLCTELKQLYVACTRPRKRLIIFDDDPSNRKVIHEIFKQVDAVQTISYNDIYGEAEKIDDAINKGLQPPLLKQQSSSSGKKYIMKLANQTSQASWRSQGIRMFKRKFYSAALHCFKKSNQPQLEKRALAYVLAEKGASLQTQSQDMMQELKIKDKSKAQLNILKEQALKVKDESQRVFIESAKLFRQLGLTRQSAQCFYSGENYNEAAISFLDIKYFAQAAECFCLSGNYDQAGLYYIQAGVHLKAVQMFMRDKNWERVLETINAAKGVLEDDQIKQLIKKYTPQALNNLFDELSKKDQELKDEEEKQSMILEEQNEEEEEEEEDEDDKEDDQVVQQDDDQEGVASGEDDVDAQQEKREEEEEEEEKEQNFKIEQKSIRQKDPQQLSNFTLVDSIDIQSNPKQIQRKQQQDEDIKSQGGSSFVSLHMSQLNSTPDKATTTQTKKISSSKSDYTIVDYTENDEDEFEHLSHIDPNDQFLKSQKGSIIDSIVSIHHQSKKAKDSKNQNLRSVASLSSYSIVQDEATTNIDASVYNKITPQRHKDLFAEDQMIQKFIYYISLISQDVRALMSQQRSKQVLIHADDQHQMPQQIEAVPAVIPAPQSKQIFLLDIDNIDVSFLQVILNTLENFQLYAFCLIICNRYQLSQNIGRYVVSLAYKYSNLYQLKIDQIDLIMNNQQELINQKEVSAIAHGAVHNVFERIDPVYLRLKKIGQEMNEKNSIGFYAYRALWMLGYWKKLAFIMDSDTSLLLLTTVRDYQGFKMVYGINFDSEKKRKQQDGEEQVVVDVRKIDWIFPRNEEQNIKELNKYETMALVQEMKQVNTKILSQIISRGADTSYQIKGTNLQYIENIKVQDIQKIQKKNIEILIKYFPYTSKYWLILSDLIQIINQKNKAYNAFLEALKQVKKSPQKNQKKRIIEEQNKIQFIFKKNQNLFNQRTNELTSFILYECFPMLKKVTNNKKIRHNFKSQELTSWDLFTALASYLIVTMKWNPFRSYINYLAKNILSYSEVLQFGSSINILARILSPQGFSFFSTCDIAVSAFSELFNCHHIPQNWLFENDSGYTIVQRKSEFIRSLLLKQKSIKNKQKLQIQVTILGKFAIKNKKSKKIQKQIQIQMQKLQGQLSEDKEIRLGDLQGQFILVPHQWVMNLIQPNIIRFGKSLLLNKLKQMVQIPYDLKNILKDGSHLDFISQQTTSMYGKELQVSLLNQQEQQKLQDEKEQNQQIQQQLNDVHIKYAKFEDIATTSRAILFSYSILGNLFKIMSLDPSCQLLYLNTISNTKFNQKRLKELRAIKTQAKEKYSLLEDFSLEQLDYSKNRLHGIKLEKNSIIEEKLAIQFFQGNLLKIIKKICRFGMLNYGTLRDIFILKQSQIKNVMLQLANDNWRKAIEQLSQIQTNELDSNQDIAAMADVFNYSFASFTYFSSINEIYILQGLLRTFKQRISKYLMLNKKLVSKFYNSNMTLIDALVYYRQDMWGEAADCLAQYTSATIEFLSYKNQVFLFEKCVMLYLASMASSGRIFNNSSSIVVQQKQYVHYPFATRKKSQNSSSSSSQFEVDFQRKLINSSRPDNLSALTKKLFGLAFNLVKVHSDDIKKEQSTMILLNSVVSMLVNAPENEIKPLQKNQVIQIFQYTMESSNFNDFICEKFITACQTKTLNEIREQVRNGQLRARDIYFSKEQNQQMSLVSVNFTKTQNKELKARQESAFKHLDKLFLQESQVLASHIYLARLFKRRIDFDSKKIRSIRNSLKGNQHCKISEYIRKFSQDGSDIDYKSVKILLRLRKDMINIIQKLSGMKYILNNIFYKSQMPNVLDVHYLLTRYGEVGQQTKRVLNDMHDDLSHGGVIEGYSGNSQKLNGNIREWIKMMRDTLTTWKMTKFQVSQASIEHKRKIIKLKWKEHRIHQAQAALKKRKGQVKQKKLADKKKRIMEKEIGRKGGLPTSKGVVKSLLAQKLIAEKSKKS